MRKWLAPLGVILVVLALGGCREKPQAQHRVLTPTESDLQEFAHEIEAVESDTIRLQSDVERVRKILLEMEQSLERLQSSTRETKRTVARLQGRPVEDDPSDQSSLGKTISWIIALFLLLMVVLLFVFKYFQTRQEGKAQNSSFGVTPSGAQTARSQSDPDVSGFETPDATRPEDSGPGGSDAGISTEKKPDVPEEPAPGPTEDAAPPPSHETPDDVDKEGDKG